MEASPQKPEKSPPATPSAWAAENLKKGPDYYEAQRDVYKEFISVNELLTIRAVFETVSYMTISLLSTDIKTRRLIGDSRE